MTPPGRRTPPAEDGFALIEVLVSALILVIVAGAVFSLLESTARSAAEERHRSEAFAIAQEDQARLRGLRISELSRLPTTPRPVTVDGTKFEVTSTGVFVNAVTSSSSCSQGATADYVRVSSTVTWPSRGSRPVARLESIVSPANGSLDPTHGTLKVTAINGASQPIPGIGISGSGAGTFAGSTDSTGCAMFADQPSGSYTLALSGAAVGLVDKNGSAATSAPASVTAGGSSTATLYLDRPGSISVSVTTTSSEGKPVASSADSFIVSNEEMSKAVGTPGGAKLANPYVIGSLFPFALITDSVYAGACSENNPNQKNEKPAPADIANVNVPAGGQVNASIQLPALYLTVWSGTPASPGTKVNGAHVIVSDEKCTVSGQFVKRTYATNSSGALVDPGLPWSTYSICADNGSRHQTVTGKEVKSLALGGTAVSLYLGSSVTTTGKCT
ncbi:MAG TPA: type II secretion system protein [Solirubrobacterales bacterium]|jgi:Tfp pilus assembly protein PilV|nr:type II secretion system protein [Solirubrobacterales bacterium]